MLSSQAQSSEVSSEPRGRRCRFCGAPLDRIVVDLGMSPLCESFRTADELDSMEPFYPLCVFMCESCHLVQLAEYVDPRDIFTEYAYFSSFSDSWVAHARSYADEMIERLSLGSDHLVVELGSNDGYLLRHFATRGVSVLGIDPAANVARAAVASGVPTLARFFGMDLASELASEGQQADLIIANNVLAQVPTINDFVAGIARLLKPDGLVTIEVPHLVRLIEGNQFDTVYHEHFSYFSLGVVARILGHHGLDIVDVRELSTHGGSLRVFCRHHATNLEASNAVFRILAAERAAGTDEMATYEAFSRRVEETKFRLIELLVDARRRGQTVAGYGAPGKANTLLNYAGIRTDLLAYTVDRNPYKQGRYTPGTHIPIHPPERLLETRPDLIWILPWNLADEIVNQLEYAREWGARFLVAIPEPRIIG